MSLHVFVSIIDHQRAMFELSSRLFVRHLSGTHCHILVPDSAGLGYTNLGQNEKATSKDRITSKKQKQKQKKKNNLKENKNKTKKKRVQFLSKVMSIFGHKAQQLFD